jgi:hypothetical protein
MNLNLNPAPRGIKHLALAWAVIAALGAQAQTSPPPAGQRAERNSASQRYEVNQTFDGRAFLKDNNIWVYTQAFADLFGMPAQYVEGVQGIAAAAFRIEDTSYQQCGMGGQANVCRKVEQCLLDLYFDESKTPLPWASDAKSQWLPWYSSMRWLRTAQPNPAHRGAVPEGVVPNETLSGALVPFADPVSKREAIFTSNTSVRGGDEAISGSLAVVGFTRDFYRSLSVVSLQFGCSQSVRNQVNIRLDAKKSGAFEEPVARFNRVVLPEGFVQRIKDLLKAQSDRNEVFYRSLFPPPLGTKGTNNEAQE